MKRHVGVVGLVLLFACVGARAASTLPVSGQVVDSRARPVAGAEVAVYETYAIAGDEHGRLIGPIVKTDEKGEFSLEAKVTSQYGTFIVARKPGLALAWDGLNYSDNTLAKGHFLLVLEEPCTLTGVVVDKSGRSVVGAKVQAVPKTSYMDRLSQRPMFAPAEWFTTQTDEKGLFRFEAFAADVSSDFRIEAPGWNCVYTFTTHYQSCCGFEVGRSDIWLVLPQEHPVKGRVVEEGTDRGVAGVSLTIAPGKDREDILNRYLAKTVVTGADGTFTCEGLPEGKNKISLTAVENETPAWVAASAIVDVAAHRDAQDVRVVVSKGGTIEALVREQGTDRPVAGHRVSVYSEEGGVSSRTDEAGRVTLRLLPGEYRPYAGGGAYMWWHVSEPTVVKAGETARVDIMLDRAPTIQGRVTDPNGKPAEDTLVTVHPFGDHAYTQSDGRFTAWYENERAKEGICVIARDRTRSLAGVVHARELTKPIDVALSPSLTVTGKVVDPNGKGIAAARASLSVLLWNCLSDMGEEVLTDSEGRFEFRAIPPVQDPFEYRVSVHAAGYAPRTYKSIAIKGEPGSVASTDPIELPPADRSISGVVVDANGAPAPRVILFLGRSGSGGEQPRKATATDEQGRFQFTRIAEGGIRLQVNFSDSPGGSGDLQCEAGDQDLKAVLGQKVVHERFASLAGKPLPDLSELGFSGNDAAVEGKAILVYFWDMQQRPSRSMLLQLVKQAEAIKDKPVVVLTVDVSGAERKSLDEWMKQSNVPFPAGVLTGGFEKKKQAWGIKAVPWLVLADQEHTVRAEGFTLDELSKKIEATTK